MDFPGKCSQAREIELKQKKYIKFIETRRIKEKQKSA